MSEDLNPLFSTPAASSASSSHKKDFLCVQSLDGTLNVFEQDTFAFSRFLPGFLLPGPIVYVARTDSLVTISSAHQVKLKKSLFE